MSTSESVPGYQPQQTTLPSLGYKLGYSTGHWLYIQFLAFITQMNFITEAPFISTIIWHPLLFGLSELWDFCKGMWEALVPNFLTNPVVSTFAMKITTFALTFVQTILDSLVTAQRREAGRSRTQNVPMAPVTGYAKSM